jgi:RNA polymerase sigma factor (sigma-70 family)
METALPPTSRMPEFAGTVKRHYPALYHFVLQRVRDREDAREIVQQSLAEALSSLDRFRGEAELSTWIFGIARNLALNHVYRSPKRRYTFEVDDALLDLEAPGARPCEQSEWNQAIAQTSRAMLEMPAFLREALELVALDGMAYEEAADALHLPLGTLKSRVARARTHLRAVVPFMRPQALG